MENYRESPTPQTLKFLYFGLAVYLMLWIAILNGYPIFFDDTGEYLVDSFGMTSRPIDP